MSFCGLKKGISLKICVYVIINKRSFESFHAFGSDFITLAVILVSDYFNTTQRLFELALGTEPNQGVYSFFL